MKSGRPLHERVQIALDSAGDLLGAELLSHVESTCADDPEVVAEVRALLSSGNWTVLKDAPGSAAREIAEQVASGGETLPGAPAVKGVPQTMPERIGPYAIVRCIGRGGMGLVYEARQEHPARRVAVKVIASGLSGRGASVRFRQEAEALGRIKHPGVAQVYEAGTDAQTGAAYIAMEYVDGPPVNAWAASQNPGVRERVEVAAAICDAVHAAHQRGVIHRDLKPGNILVETGDGGEFHPKVLDFGVARLVDQAAEAGATLAVEAARIVGTIGYISPEALSEEAASVDTRTDVFALGVILFELLAGKPPIEVAGVSIAEAVRRVRDQAPLRLKDAMPGAPTDLSIIAAKAMEKDRAHRYASAAELAEDLRRWLHHQPIAARPHGAWYVLRRFARRNRAVTAGVCIAFLSVSAGLAVSLVQTNRARAALAAEARQSRITNVLSDFVLQDIIGAARSDRLGYDAKVLDAVISGEKNLTRRIGDDPLVEAPIRQQLGEMLQNLGRYDEALVQFRRAQELHEREDGPDSDGALAAACSIGVTYGFKSDWEECVRLQRDVLLRTTEKTPNHARLRSRAINSLAHALTALKQYAEAEALYTQSLPETREIFGPTDETVLAMRQNYATLLMSTNREQQAADALAELLTDQDRLLGPAHPYSLGTRNNLVNAYLRLGRIDDAWTLARDMPRLMDETFPEGHISRTLGRAMAAAAASAAGEHGTALELSDDAFTLAMTSHGLDRWETEVIARRASDYAARAHDADSLMRWTREALRCRLAAATDGQRNSVPAMVRDMGRLRNRVVKEQDPSALLEEFLRERGDIAPKGSPYRARILANLARAAASAEGGEETALFLLKEAEEALPSSNSAEETIVIITAVKEKASPKAP